jgi:hypothetical protein
MVQILHTVVQICTMLSKNLYYAEFTKYEFVLYDIAQKSIVYKKSILGKITSDIS